jgi:hypothetical protein
VVSVDGVDDSAMSALRLPGHSSAGCGCGRLALIRQTEPQILQLVAEGAGPQVRVKPPQTGVLTSKRASDPNRVVRTNVIAGPNCIDRGRLWPTMSSTSDIGEPAGRAEPSRALPRQHQLVVWTQIGYSVVNYVIGLLGGEPTSA